MMKIEYNNRNPDVGNNSDSQSIISNGSNGSETINSEIEQKNKKGKCYNLSILDMLKIALCVIIFILLFIQVILFAIYNNSNKKNEASINELKEILNTTDSGSMINKKN